MLRKSTRNQKKREIVGIVMVLAFGVLIGLPAAAGTIVGKVKYDGTPPPPRTAKVEQNTEVCGTEQQSEFLIVGPDQGLKWAVVQVADAGGATPRSEPPTMDQNGCRFVPRVVIARPGEELAVLNSDGILHNVHTVSEKNTPINKAQPGFVKSLPVTFAEPEMVRLKCDVHGWMRGWIMVTDDPAAVTDDSGSFTVTDVPAGTHEVTVWHEKLGRQTKEVTVADGGETVVDFRFSPK